jgi:hypothetical protein
MEFHVTHVTSEMPSYMENKRKVYINVSTEFRANLHSKNLMIDKSLYGLKTFVDRFHEH